MVLFNSNGGHSRLLLPKVLPMKGLRPRQYCWGTAQQKNLIVLQLAIFHSIFM
jgi:hypothetical protein